MTPSSYLSLEVPLGAEKAWATIRRNHVDSTGEAYAGGSMVLFRAEIPELIDELRRALA